jgi:transcriptional regulator with XRE-family HTH domain
MFDLRTNVTGGQVRRTISRHEELRRAVGLTVTAVAATIGVSRAYASRVEGGLIPASLRYQRAFAQLLRVPENFVFDEDGRVR